MNSSQAVDDASKSSALDLSQGNIRNSSDPMFFRIRIGRDLMRRVSELKLLSLFCLKIDQRRYSIRSSQVEIGTNSFDAISEKFDPLKILQLRDRFERR